MSDFSRRSVLALGGAFALAGPALAQSEGRFDLTPTFDEVPVRPLDVKFIEGFEPTEDVRTVEREVGLALDYSESMDISEVTQSISGAIDGITNSKLLASGEDSFCQGAVGLMIAVFRDSPFQYGYMVIKNPEQADLAK